MLIYGLSLYIYDIHLYTNIYLKQSHTYMYMYTLFIINIIYTYKTSQ